MIIISCLLCADETSRIVSQRTVTHPNAITAVAGCTDNHLLEEISPRASFILDESKMTITHGIIPNVYFVKTYAVQLNTGCVGTCTFCRLQKRNRNNHSSSFDNVYHTISQNYDPNIIYTLFSNDCGANSESVVNICWKLYTQFPNIKLNIHYVNNHYFITHYKDIGELFAQNILQGIGTSVQSASERILRLMGRTTDLYKLHEAIQHVRSRMLPKQLLYSEFIYGFPTETEIEVLESCKFATLFTHVLWYQYMKVSHTLSAEMFPECILGKDYSDIIQNFAQANNIPSIIYNAQKNIAWGTKP